MDDATWWYGFSEDEAQEIWDTFNTDGDDRWSTDEQNAFYNWYYAWDEDTAIDYLTWYYGYDEAEARDVFAEFDANGDGRWDTDE